MAVAAAVANRARVSSSSWLKRGAVAFSVR